MDAGTDSWLAVPPREIKIVSVLAWACFATSFGDRYVFDVSTARRTMEILTLCRDESSSPAWWTAISRTISYCRVAASIAASPEAGEIGSGRPGGVGKLRWERIRPGKARRDSA